MRHKLIFTLLLVLGLYLIGTSLNDIWELKKRGEETQRVQVKLEKVKKEREDLQKRLEYVKSTEFIEKEAREKLGRSKPGETILILPENVEKVMGVEEEQKKEELPNWRLWYDLFF